MAEDAPNVGAEGSQHAAAEGGAAVAAPAAPAAKAAEALLPSLSIWPPSQRTRDAVVRRLVQTLAAPSILSQRYGAVPEAEAERAAAAVEAEAYAAVTESSSAGAAPASVEDGIEVLQAYSKEVSRRLLELAKSRSAAAAPAAAAAAPAEGGASESAEAAAAPAPAEDSILGGRQYLPVTELSEHTWEKASSSKQAKKKKWSTWTEAIGQAAAIRLGSASEFEAKRRLPFENQNLFLSLCSPLAFLSRQLLRVLERAAIHSRGRETVTAPLQEEGGRVELSGGWDSFLRDE
uniref:WPP domain-containing protein n=1 Tax=Oryza punctata TaxID=4537 RepID=A0A0E0LMX5_ORYPU